MNDETTPRCASYFDKSITNALKLLIRGGVALHEFAEINPALTRYSLIAFDVALSGPGGFVLGRVAELSGVSDQLTHKIDQAESLLSGYLTTKLGLKESAADLLASAGSFGLQFAILGIVGNKSKQVLDAAHKVADKVKAGISQKSRIKTINSRRPINSEYAGGFYPLEKLPLDLRSKYPHSVPFTGAGHPDFSRYAQKKVQINMTGNNKIDRKLANQASGYKQTPAGYTWHHSHDGKTMMLVPSELHNAVKHTGGVALMKKKND